MLDILVFSELFELFNSVTLMILTELVFGLDEVGAITVCSVVLVVVVIE